MLKVTDLGFNQVSQGLSQMFSATSLIWHYPQSNIFNNNLWPGGLEEKYILVSLIWELKTISKASFSLYAVVVWSVSGVQLFGNPVDCSPPDSSVHGISQARILEWVPFPPPTDLPDQKDQSHISYGSCICRWILYHWATFSILSFDTFCVMTLCFYSSPYNVCGQIFSLSDKNVVWGKFLLISVLHKVTWIYLTSRERTAILSEHTLNLSSE